MAGLAERNGNGRKLLVLSRQGIGFLPLLRNRGCVLGRPERSRVDRFLAIAAANEPRAAPSNR